MQGLGVHDRGLLIWGEWGWSDLGACFRDLITPIRCPGIVFGGNALLQAVSSNRCVDECWGALQ